MLVAEGRSPGSFIVCRQWVGRLEWCSSAAMDAGSGSMTAFLLGFGSMADAGPSFAASSSWIGGVVTLGI
ncbi:unnamed protein product [Linum trigynum]|uniref:Uncharacterized protein n=1 Tax=Linum trigynum TaxID=586398 RepID=A0AAV2ENE2_9ROSI